MTSSEIKEVINSELSEGDSEEEIIQFFEEQGWPHNYDRFNKRFYARLPDTAREEFDKSSWGYQIYIYVDSNKAFKRAEVQAVHRSPL